MKRVELERRAEAAFRRHRGVLRTSHTLKLGILHAFSTAFVTPGGLSL